MATLYYYKFNNYYNRKLKRFSSLSEYQSFMVFAETGNNLNFNPNDGVNTQVTAGRQENPYNVVADYCIYSEDNSNITSRWFIIEASRNRGNQYKISLRRDLLADFYDSWTQSDCFVEKAILPDDSPFIYNQEQITTNQIKTDEVELKDDTKMAWICGFINRESPETQVPIKSAVKADITKLTYDDYQKYLKEHPDEAILQGDTVEGVKGGKCILTLTWASWDFQLGFLRDHNNSASVTAIVDHLYELLGEEPFHQVFPSVWLLDNGAEFSDPKEIEKYGILVFYCDPSAPYQKGACENTHEHFRRICPKGTSFNDFTQEQIDLIFSQTNSIYRKKLNDHCPYDLFSHLCASGIDVKKIFNISWVDPKEVELTPSLLSGFRRSLDKNKL